ncbi:phosphohydrolase [Bacteroidales bacterium]|nr:phosphohydrolase [Bacteroidales bacterium]
MNSKIGVDQLIKKFYTEGSDLYKILYSHSLSVANKSLEIGSLHPEMGLDKAFIYEASLLHDIGIFLTEAPDIFCFGISPYICHGYLGHALLSKENYPRHALVCERHTGSGISKERILRQKLPLPLRNMMPISNEELLICFADKFYSKSRLEEELSIDQIRKGISRYGDESLNNFNSMLKAFLG